MRKSNSVSIWLGNFKSLDDLKSYVRQDFNEDGDVTSFFMEDFNIDYYDHDMEEINHASLCSNDSITLIEDLSYSSSIIDLINISDLNNYNSIICIFDFEYGSVPKKTTGCDFKGVYANKK